MTRTITVESEDERLFVEAALAAHREVQAAALNAPDGQVLAITERLAVQQGDALLGQLLQQSLQQRIEQAEKKGRRRGSAHIAKSPAAAADKTDARS